jgi:methyltransferase (TIGR00027 family)
MHGQTGRERQARPGKIDLANAFRTVMLMEKIEHVSDTALMIAAFRAIENDREDGLVRDPFAAALAGEKGMAIAHGSSATEWMSFAIGVRSRFMDDLLLGVFDEGKVQTVVNLGAGLDTRPWRMKLPANLRWIEADFPEMLAYKSERLIGSTPGCELQRVAADVTRRDDRERIFRAVGDAPALMMTEGLLMYLPQNAITALATESVSGSGICRWIFDVSALDLMRRAHGDLVQAIESVRAEGHLEARQTVDAVLAEGWRTATFRSYTRESASVAMERIAKLVEAMETPPEQPPPDEPSGVYLLEHQPLN